MSGEVALAEAGRATAQRRILEAMAEVAAEGGYAEASVARVIERAGVSRATFYANFESRGDCFASLYRETAAQLRECLANTAATHRAELPGAALAAVLGAAERDPARARVMAIEAPGVAVTRGAHELLIEDLRRAAEDTASSSRLQVPSLALIGGIAGVIEMRLLSERESLSVGLGEELAAWVGTYALPAAEHPLSQADWEALGRPLGFPRASREGEAERPFLPRGRSALAGGTRAEARRELILAATARVVAAKGYAALTVADIVKEARVSRGAFYSHFQGKLDAFCAAQTAGLQAGIAAAAAEFALGRDWPERVWGGLRGVLTYLAEHPGYASLGLPEAHAAGAEALGRDHAYRMAFAVFLEEGLRTAAAARLPPVLPEAIASAIRALLSRQVGEGRSAQLLELLPQCAYVVLAPFLGPRPAARFVARRAAGGD